MAKEPDIDPEDMYAAWLACNRNATEAAASLGMNSATLSYHARHRNFQSRYASEYSGIAASSIKMAVVEKAQKFNLYLDRLDEIILNSENERNVIAAFKEMRDVLVANPQSEEDNAMSVIEAQGMVKLHSGSIPTISLSPLGDVETAIRESAESNIIDASELRSRRKSS